MFFNIEIYSMMLEHQSKKIIHTATSPIMKLKKGTAIDENWEYLPFCVDTKCRRTKNIESLERCGKYVLCAKKNIGGIKHSRYRY